MPLSQLAETLIGSEIVRLGGEIKEKIRQGAHIYNFTVGDFDPAIFPIPKELEQGIIEAYQKHYTNYPAAEGNLDLRETLSSFIQERQKLNYSINEIVVAAGGRPLIYTIFRTVCDKGDKVIYAVPYWNNNHYTHFRGRTCSDRNNRANSFYANGRGYSSAYQKCKLAFLMFTSKSNRYNISKRRTRGNLRFGSRRK